MNTANPQLNATPDIADPINPHVYKAQSEVLKTVDTFIKNGSSDAVEAINALLYHWLSRPPAKRSRKQLSQVLSVVNFLVKLSDQYRQVEEVKTLTGRVQKGE